MNDTGPKRPTVLHLVHGTWPFGLLEKLRPSGYSSRMGWFAAGGAFERSLAAALGPTVSIKRFRWSGRNGQAAREVAASAFRAHLLQSFLEDRDAIHFIVAHSHGGNVALLALRGLGGTEFAGSFGGVVTMATPFVSFWSYGGGRSERAVRLFPVLLFIAAAFAAPVSYAIGVDMPQLARNMLYVATAVLGAAFSLSARRLVAWARRLRPLSTSGTWAPLLVVRASGDEAFLALIVPEIGERVTGALLRPLLRLTRMLDRRGVGGVAYALYWSGAVLFLLGNLKTVAASSSTLVKLTWLIFIVAWGIPLSLAAVVGAVEFALGVAAALAFGWTALTTKFLFESRVDVIPAGSKGEFFNPGSAGKRLGSMDHSVYGLKIVQERIAMWIAARS